MTWAMFSGLYRPFTARRSGRLGTTVDALSNVSVDDQPARPVKQFGDVNLNMSQASIFIYIPGIRYKYNIPGIYIIYLVYIIYILYLVYIFLVRDLSQRLATEDG